MIDRRRSRILAMQSLCQLEALGDDWLSQLDDFLADEGDVPAVQAYARELVRAIWPGLAALDERIAAASEHWDVKRMPVVDRNILRVGVRELLNADPAVPPRVAMDEAIEIGKLFGTAESPAFINGVLDQVLKSLSPATTVEQN